MWECGEMREPDVDLLLEQLTLKLPKLASVEALRARAARRAAWGLGPAEGEGARPPAFRDRDGNCWNVDEVDTGALEWGRGRHCLIFSSETAIRRVWAFPAN